MSIWARVKTALGGARKSGEVGFEGDRVVLKDLERARTFPQEPADSGLKVMRNCEKCSAPLQLVVFTTAGSGEQLAIWKAYPLAIDGWLCRACGWSALPRFISAEESVEYGRRGAEQAQARNFDDAEFWFRRILGSWPGYGPGYADLGQLNLTRAEATKDPNERTQRREQAVGLFRKALATGGTLGGVRAPLARAVALLGREPEALQLLKDLESDIAADEGRRSEGRQLLEDLQAGKALFSQATERMGAVIFEPSSRGLAPSDRKHLEEARALLHQALDRKATFGSQFFLGKAELRLGNFTKAADAFEVACAIDPEQADGYRELSSAYLELGRNQEALRAAERALALRPEDATLRCNLAFVLLLASDLERARREAKLALDADPSDSVTQAVVRLIEDVASGRRKRPESLAEAEGREP
jgi:tetratricopeptide (TPR) repeat protein